MNRSRRFGFAVGVAMVLVFLIGPALFVGETQTLPAPTVDHVGFPAGYRAYYTLLYTFDNYQNRQIRAVYANPVAASVTTKRPARSNLTAVGRWRSPATRHPRASSRS